MTDLDLLRAYEPIVRYNQGELFFPTAVDGTSPSAICGRVSRSAIGRCWSRRASSRRTSSRRMTRRRGRRCSSDSSSNRSRRSSSPAGRGARIDPCSRHRADSPGSGSSLDSSTPGSTCRSCSAGTVPGRDRRRRRDQVRARPRARPAVRLLRPGGPQRRLDRPPLHVLLLHERLALDLPAARTTTRRTSSSRSSCSRRVRRPDAGLVRLRRPRLLRRRPPTPLGRSAARPRGRPSGHPCRSRLPRGLLRAWRVPDRRADPGARADPRACWTPSGLLA